MGMLWIKLYDDFYTHRKTLRLRAALGLDALWIPPRLWLSALSLWPDGNLRDTSAAELALTLGYGGDAEKMIGAMEEAGFLERNANGERIIRNWTQRNRFHAVNRARARKAARARHAVETVRPGQVIALEKKIKRAEQRMEELRGQHRSEMATGNQWTNEAARAEHRDLRLKVEGWKKQIAT